MRDRGEREPGEPDPLLTWIFVLVVVVSWLLVTPTSCTDAPDATRRLERIGYTNIVITGYEWFGCGDSGTYNTGFRAVKNGKTVQGVVCKGINKSSSILFH